MLNGKMLDANHFLKFFFKYFFLFIFPDIESFSRSPSQLVLNGVSEQQPDETTLEYP